MSRRKIVEDKIAAWKKEVLSPYCLEKCETSCCHLSRGAIITDEAGLKALLEEEEEEELDRETLARHLDPTWENKKRLPVYRYEEDPCRQLDTETNKCKIYEHPDKPDICSKYPVAYLERNLISKTPFIGVQTDCEGIKKALRGGIDDSVLKIGLEHGLRTVFF